MTVTVTDIISGILHGLKAPIRSETSNIGFSELLLEIYSEISGTDPRDDLRATVLSPVAGPLTVQEAGGKYADDAVSSPAGTVESQPSEEPSADGETAFEVPEEIAEEYSQWLAEERKKYQPGPEYWEQLGYTPLEYGALNSNGTFCAPNSAYWFMPWLVPEGVDSRNPLADAYGLMAMMGFSISDIPMAYGVLTGQIDAHPDTEAFYVQQYRRLSLQTGITIPGIDIA